MKAEAKRLCGKCGAPLLPGKRACRAKVPHPTRPNSFQTCWARTAAYPPVIEGAGSAEAPLVAAIKRAEAVEKREEHVREMLASWERKLQRAESKVKEYARKVRYYEKRRDPVPGEATAAAAEVIKASAALEDAPDELDQALAIGDRDTVLRLVRRST